jgi:hypothetical protein
MAEDYTAQFRKVTTTQSIDEQAMTFLRAFVGEFQGKFEEVLQLAEEFRAFASQVGHVQELDEFEAHRFLEKKGETKTVKDMRQELEEIDIDKNHKVAFLEYLLFRFVSVSFQFQISTISGTRRLPKIFSLPNLTPLSWPNWKKLSSNIKQYLPRRRRRKRRSRNSKLWLLKEEKKVSRLKLN